MNRTILITGANNGIGLTLTRSLLETGDRVAALDLETNNLDQTYPSLLLFRCDVTQPQHIQSVVDEVLSKWGRTDILINNAPILSSDFMNGIQLWVSYHFRVQMGKLLAKMTKRAKK